jgi:hypothetical protein
LTNPGIIIFFMLGKGTVRKKKIIGAGDALEKQQKKFKC